MTGTDTDVGKTVVTACLTAAALAEVERVAVYKPAQTGVRPDEPGDVDTVAALLGHPDRLTVAEGVRLGPAMAPVDAALEAGGEAAVEALPGLRWHLDRIAALAAEHGMVLVEGAGGLLVQLTADGATIADLALATQAPLAVVTRPDLGTLNHTELTLEAAARRGVRPGPLVIGSWPARPTAVHRSNELRLRELAREHGYAWGGAVPAHLGAAAREDLHRAAAGLTGVVPGRHDHEVIHP
ncbi:dethiobiotin synthase [Nesterenkonia sphaerica]|uniref:dethiobiotin synthase n=1 Tax=Nesterenkonia sphaerica TaxID=1804988 RepID=UPI001FB8275E|nr:dethiobiotin synthase [Nesterenkonia sphaerica]